MKVAWYYTTEQRESPGARTTVVGITSNHTSPIVATRDSMIPANTKGKILFDLDLHAMVAPITTSGSSSSFLQASSYKGTAATIPTITKLGRG